MLDKQSTLFFLSLLLAPMLVFSSNGIDTITLTDAVDLPTAVAELKQELESQGFSIPLIVNHAGAAASIGEDLPPNQVIFARPPRYLELRLLRTSPTISIDLPWKFHVYEADGAIKLAFNTLGYLIDRHKMSVRDFTLWLTNRLLKQFGSSNLNGLVTMQSNRSMAETVTALENAILENPDARIPLKLDYSNGFFFRRYRFPVLIVFGNPKVGTPLMEENPAIGLDLPQKFLIWENKQGEVFITYNDPFFIAERVNLKEQDTRLEALSNALKTLASKGAAADN